AGLDLAEATAAGAVLAADQERGLAHLPALVDVRAAGLLAHGVELQAAHELLEVAEVVPERRLDLQPLGLAPLVQGRVDGRSHHPGTPGPFGAEHREGAGTLGDDGWG